MQGPTNTDLNLSAKASKGHGIPTISRVLGDGMLIELLYDPKERKTSFAIWNKERARIEPNFALDPGHLLIPYSPENNLIKHEVILFPVKPEEYGTEENLVCEIQSFIHRYVDLSAVFETIASYYVLLSWVYDAFNELPYLRVRRDCGSGKTRFLLVVGSLCYTPVFASGASSISPIFHILDSFRGTLIMDEGDFRFSDEKAEIVKILNNGNVKGFPVLRCEVNRYKEFNPRAFNVFGPKVLATRGHYDDKALESRFLAEDMGGSPLREDIPINLPGDWKEEARTIRNKLLLFRFRHHATAATRDTIADPALEPRMNQIYRPLLALMDDPKTREMLLDFGRKGHKELVLDRGMEIEAQVLSVIRELSLGSRSAGISIKHIANRLNEKHGLDYERAITPKWIRQHRTTEASPRDLQEPWDLRHIPGRKEA